MHLVHPEIFRIEPWVIDKIILLQVGKIKKGDAFPERGKPGTLGLRQGVPQTIKIAHDLVGYRRLSHKKRITYIKIALPYITFRGRPGNARRK